ncbi:MAG: hypothetical protein M0P57_01595 [Syntrophales bacterium]|jgi:hypothetical protein|nr:hypothetical protein [Syntrophales bacterium]MDY0043377.1 hypothetical protein [Syntrophales bacterium]
MKNIFLKAFLPVLFAMVLTSCGGLRYTKHAPEAQNFRPEKIGVLCVKAGPYKDIEDKAEKIISESLQDTNWFSSVLAPDAIRIKTLSDGSLKENIAQYLMKLEKVSFSDPDLTNRIGDVLGVDAFLVVGINFWNYTIENNKEVAKVGFGMNLIEKATGKILWTCEHHESENYFVKKPKLASLARDVAKKMISDMPH